MVLQIRPESHQDQSTAWRKGPNVTNPICWTCKNCSMLISVLLTVNIVSHKDTTQHGAVLIIFPLNLQTIT